MRPLRRLRGAAALAALIVSFGGSAAVVAQAPPQTPQSASAALAVAPNGLVSLTSSGARSDRLGATGGSVSADGRLVAFASLADVFDREPNGMSDVLVRDTATRVTVQASTGVGGAAANGPSFGAHLSGNGRYVAFSSAASNLVADDTNDVSDAFVHDLETGVTRLASITSTGAQLDQPSQVLDISDDGRTLLLAVASEQAAQRSVVLQVIRWRSDAVTTVGTSSGSLSGSVAPSASLSGDGSIVVFTTREALDPADDDDDVDVYALELGAAAPTLLSTNALVGPGGVGEHVQVSADGVTAIFVADQRDDDSTEPAWAVVAVAAQPFDPNTGDTGDTGDSADPGGVVILDAGGQMIEGLAPDVRFSTNRDASVVAFSTVVPVDDDTNGASDVFVRNRIDDTTFRVSVERHGFEATGASFLSGARSISDDGLTVAFTSGADDLIFADENEALDVFVATPAQTCAGRFISVFVSAGEVPTEEDDVILGTRRSDSIDALAGDDIVCGGDGNDFVLGGSGSDELYGEAGADILEGGDGNDRVFGGAGNDKMYGDEGNDQLRGEAGNDLVDGGVGRDRLFGDAGIDTLLGGKGADLLHGGAGADDLSGGASNDKLLGKGGGDSMRGGAGRDTIKGGRGNDAIDGGAGKDRIDGGSGSDTCVADLRSPNERIVRCPFGS